MKRYHGILSFTIFLALGALCATSARADKIITKSGQTLEGVIKDENQFGIRLDDRGNIISVPRERIRKIARIGVDDNVRMLLDRAMESVSRMDVGGARAYIEQAQTLNPTTQAVLDQIDKVSRKVQEMEIRGGTPEERRMRSQALVARAKEAYDLIRTQEGNTLLLQALQTDPSNQDAHAMINKLLTRDNAPDTMLAAEYFVRVVWPDNVKPDSPVIKLLPRIYGDLAQLFNESSDPERAVKYAQQMQKISEAFSRFPTWKETSDDKLKATLAQPVDELLANMIKGNLEKGSFELALHKLQGWTQPEASAAVCDLFLRAQVGAEHYPEAIAMLEKAMPKFPDDTSLKPQYNALKLLAQGMAVEKTDKRSAVTTYESIFASRESLKPEIVDKVGKLLATLKGPEMDPAVTSNDAAQVAKAADIATMVMRYGQDQSMRRHAAQVIIALLRKLPWKLDLVWQINGKNVPLTEEIVTKAQEQVRRPLGITFDQTSPFVVKLTINAGIKGNADDAAQSLSSGQTLDPPVSVIAYKFNLEALHPTLGSLYANSWTSLNVPQAAVPIPVDLPAAAKPTPKPTPAASPAPGAAPTPAASPAPTAKPAAPAAAPDAGGLLQIASMDAIKSFVERGLAPYIQGWPKVTLLPSHLIVPQAQAILTAE